jgi:hypothetical protein
MHKISEADLALFKRIAQFIEEVQFDGTSNRNVTAMSEIATFRDISGHFATNLDSGHTTVTYLHQAEGTFNDLVCTTKQL